MSDTVYCANCQKPVGTFRTYVPVYCQECYETKVEELTSFKEDMMNLGK